MHLQYSAIDLQIERTAEFNLRATRDHSDLDYLATEVTIGMVCLWNPWSTTSNLPQQPQPLFAGGPPVNAIPNALPPGDRLGVAIKTLYETLMTPRQSLKIWIGGDLVFQVPQPVNGLVVGGAPRPTSVSDPMGGPFPEDCRILEIKGDKTAIVYYRIRFYVTNCNRYCLSNRWRMESHTDETFTTTRIVHGRAKFRVDWLQDQQITADQFRSALVVPMPDGFNRKRINVVATEDGSEVDYTVIDQQTQRNLGLNYVVKVEGNATAGVEYPFKDAKSALMGAVKELKSISSALNVMGGMPDPSAIGMALAGMAINLMPTAKANVLVKMYGRHTAPQNEPPNGMGQWMSNWAIRIALDRLSPLVLAVPVLGNIWPIASAYLTQDFGSDNSPYVELRMELLPMNMRLIGALLNPATVGTLMNLDLSLPFATTTAIQNQSPPYSGGTRGDYLVYMVTQALTTTKCQPVPDVPADGKLPITNVALNIANDGDLKMQ